MDQWPLVGRDDELALACSTVSERGSVVLTGPAGVGKTRLAREILQQVATTGARTEWVAATEAAATIPLGAVAHLIPSTAIGGGRDATLRAVVAALDSSDDDDTLVLGVDDAQLLDEASAALIHLLVTSRAVTAVVTVRHGETVPDAIVSLWKDGPAPLVALQALSQTEVDHLVTTALDGSVDRRLLEFLWSSSRGNALFLCELMRDGIQSRALRAEQGVWRWNGALAPGERLQDVVAMRMGRVDDDERSALEVLAVAGMLNQASVSALGHEGAVAQLERRGLVTSNRETRDVRLAHPLFGEVVRAPIPLGRLDEIRRALADALEATTELTPQDTMRVALWRAESGDRTHPAQLVTAARHAWAIGAATVAELLARAALGGGSDLEASYLLGEALTDQGRTDEALAQWQAVDHLPGPDALHAAIARTRAGVLAFQHDRPEDAAEVLRRALERSTDEDARRSVIGFAGVIATVHPRGAELEVANAVAASPTTGVLTPGVALLQVVQDLAAGHLDAAVATIDEVMGTATEWTEEMPETALVLGMARVWALGLAGRVHEGRTEADDRYEACLLDGIDQTRGSRWCLVRGMLALAAGHPRAAVAMLEEGATVLENVDPGFLRPTRANLAMAYALLGDVSAATREERNAGAAATTFDGIFGVDVRRASAWVFATRGELSAAARCAQAAAELGAAGEQWAFEALAHHDVARLGQATSVVDRLDHLAASVDGDLVDLFAAHARGLAGHDGPALDTVSEAFADLGYALFAAEASASAAGAHRRAGRKGSAFAAAARARELAGRCEGARTPLLVSIDQPDGLTVREREVAELAATGLPSRDIGARLDISVRTVDNLLGRVYTKLGLSGRDELADVLGHRKGDGETRVPS